MCSPFPFSHDVDLIFNSVICKYIMSSNNNEFCMFDIASLVNNKPLSVHLVDAKDKRASRSTGCTALAIIAPANNSSSRDVITKTKVIVGGSNGTVKLWEVSSCNLGRNNKKHTKPVWTITSLDGKISEIVHIESGLVLISTATGSFFLFDIYKCERKSFSSLKTPEQIKSWTLTNGMANQSLPRRDCLAVKKCHLIGKKRNILGSAATVLCDLILCLKCGWVIKMQMDVIQIDGNSQLSRVRFGVIHKPSFVNYRDDEGNKVIKPNPSICVPEFPVPSALMLKKESLYVLMADVRPIEYVLPSRDKRVQGDSNDGMQFRNRYDHDKILIINPRKSSQGAEGVMENITLPKGGKLKQMAMHPDNIWLVVTIDNMIRLMRVQTPKKKKRTQSLSSRVLGLSNSSG